MDTKQSEEDIILCIWNRYLLNKDRYEKGEYSIVNSRSAPKKFLTHLSRISSQIQKNNASINHWIDAQFFFFYLHFSKIPYINQLYSEGAHDRYLTYMKENRKNECIEYVPKDVSLSAQERVSYGKGLLKRFRKLHPTLTRNMVVKLFADQFPEEFLVWYVSRHSPSVEQQVRRVFTAF